MQDLPLTPPSFFWSKAASTTDKMVHEWIYQMKEQDEIKMKAFWDVVLFGVPLSRSSISPSGASEFPEAFRRSWKGFSTYNIDHEIDLSELSVADLGDVSMHFTDINKSHQNIKEISQWAKQTFPRSFPVAIGGDHSITAMLVAGIKNCEPEQKIGLIQFDTHLDLRDLKPHGPTNGTPIRNLIESKIVEGDHIYNIGVHGFYNNHSLIQFAKENGVHYIPLREMRKQGVQQTVTRVLNELSAKVDSIYLTVDMDVLDISIAPGVAASTPGGMHSNELFEAVYSIGMGQKVKAMDIVCIDPTKDSLALPTVKAGTHVFLSFLSGLVKRRQKMK